MSMKPEIKALWVAALRSGEYRQGFERLRHVDCYCCLGVLTDLYCKETGMAWDEAILSRGIPDDMALSSQVQKWAGLKEASPIAKGRLLADCNDGVVRNDAGENERTPFSTIADMIEKEL